MRIAIATVTNRRVGGVETYLSTVIPALVEQGHKVAFFHEINEPKERDTVALPEGSPSWCVAELGKKRSLALLQNWHPELIYAHTFANPGLESQVQKIAPSVFFIHDYYGICVSGLKSFKKPVVSPCNRQLGWRCLVNYFPHRCGGLNPLTMVKLYNLQSKRLESLRRYDGVATHSEYLMNELVLSGVEKQRVHKFPYYVKQAKTFSEDLPLSPVNSEFWQLLFIGRQEYLKGGHVFLESLPEVSEALGGPLRVTFAGDGQERERLQRQAARLQQSHPELQIEFPGWLDRQQMDALLARADLLVVPSLWPEPFGLVGPEAGLRGVPAAAFAVGGITEWLKDGVNGALAAGNPPTAGGLAKAIIRCLRDPGEHACMRRNAIEIAQQFNLTAHLDALMRVFDQAIEHRRTNMQRKLSKPEQ